MLRRSNRFWAVMVTTVAMWSCGSGSSYDSNSTTTSPSPTPTGAVTVSIVGSTGSGSFVPNPVQVAAGGALEWKNNDTTSHHIVLDDGSADLGTLAPGATTRSLTVAGTSAMNFHCTLHPLMVGSINGATAPEADPNNPYPTGRPR